MARYDVYQGSDDILLLDVQADLLDRLKTRIVVPLILRDKAPQPAQRLNPFFRIGENDYVMVTQFMASIETTELKSLITNISHEHDTIISALDMIMQGF